MFYNPFPLTLPRMQLSFKTFDLLDNTNSNCFRFVVSEEVHFCIFAACSAEI